MDASSVAMFYSIVWRTLFVDSEFQDVKCCGLVDLCGDLYASSCQFPNSFAIISLINSTPFI